MNEVRSFLTTEQLFLLVLYMDLIAASLLVFHLGFLFKLPLIGAKLSALVEDGQFFLQSNPWMKRATFVGLVAFIMFPLAATGIVGGSIFGRLLGMSRLATFVGTAIGGVLGCALMYFGNGLSLPMLRHGRTQTQGGRSAPSFCKRSIACGHVLAGLHQQMRGLARPGFRMAVFWSSLATFPTADCLHRFQPSALSFQPDMPGRTYQPTITCLADS